jgi:hypothetical protein
VVLDLEAFTGMESDLFGVDFVSRGLRRNDAGAGWDGSAAGVGL